MTGTRPRSEVERVKEDLDAIEDELLAVYAEADTWNFQWGPLRLSRPFHSGMITRIFVAFSVSTFAFGTVLALIDGARELGVAMVVGSIFSFGSFLMQFWAAAVQKELTTHEMIWGERRRQDIRRLVRRHSRLLARLDQLEPSGEDD